MSDRQPKDKDKDVTANPAREGEPSLGAKVGPGIPTKQTTLAHPKSGRDLLVNALDSILTSRASDSLSTLLYAPSTTDRIADLLYRPELRSGSFRVLSEKEDALAEEIARLRKQLADQTAAALEAQKQSGQAERELDEARRSQQMLQAKERLNFVLNRIHPDARAVLLSSTELQRQFLESTTCTAYVMSIDIRRSTDLMLKTRRPELFARFISELCGRLRDIILAHNGVFDKFTGDGILAFFPDFYSGPDGGYSVVSAADAAHAAFGDHYNSNRDCFVSIIKDVGLGIGIDHGIVNLVQVGDGLTVVGTPVVYACRMGAAPAGTTLLNQPAYEEIFERFSETCTFGETELDVKHEGLHLAYSVHLNGKKHCSQPAAWRSFETDAA